MTEDNSARAKCAPCEGDRCRTAGKRHPAAIVATVEDSIGQIEAQSEAHDGFEVVVCPREDFAVIAAELMLRRAIGDANLIAENVTAGSVVMFVAAPTQAWVGVLRTAWATRLALDPRRVIPEREGFSRSSDNETKIFAPRRQPGHRSGTTIVSRIGSGAA